ncbi:MAG: hypothetical protein JWM80_5164 [Cyanobacteria bacterium RYN_339]|nr:hypothetical protein [Cyanobacteria bacterium RYN_339]
MLNSCVRYALAFSVSLLSACAATMPASAPAPAAAAPAAATGDEDSRAIHGSTIKVGAGLPSNGITGTAGFQLASDSLGVNRMGFWNPVSVDANGGSNTNFGQDYHVQLILPTVTGSVTVSKVTLRNNATGGTWDSMGYPAHQFVGVYSNDGLTQLLAAGSTTNATAVSSGQYFNMYMDTGNPDTPNNVVRAGDTFDATLETSAGTVSFPGLRL